MRVLVAGGAGMIGSALCQRLIARGDEVVVVDNLCTGSRDNIDDLMATGQMSFVQADVAAEVPVTGPFDAVFNLACPPSPVDFDRLSLEILEVGSRGLSNLLDLARSRGCRILHASSSEVYGEPFVHPQSESYWGNVNPVGPRSVYDEAKRFGEALATAYHRRHGTPVRIARIFNTYGPRMRSDDGRVISNLVTQALHGEPLTIYGDGSQTRSFCYVEDQVSGLIALLESDVTTPVNIGGDQERTVREVAELVLRLTGSSSGIVYKDRPEDDPSQRRPDLSLARKRLGWEPTTTLEDGLARTIDWFRSQAPA